MPRSRRQIIYGRPYEIVFRVREGLPFVCTEYMRIILLGILARAQRDEKVILCGYIVMGNHWHLIIVTKDAEQATRFYKELKKAATEATKRLLGLDTLTMWERSTVILLATAEDVIDRLGYLYANPAEADMVETIGDYPGLSSWVAFEETPNQVEAGTTSEHFWISAASIPTVTNGITPHKDQSIAQQMIQNARAKHELTVEPNAWMRCFDIEDSEVAETKDLIKGQIKQREDIAHKNRILRKTRVVGAAKLKLKSPSIQGHKPKKKERKIFVICRNVSLRARIISQFKEFCAECAECYRRWRERAEHVVWPPGAFVPPLGRTQANALTWD